MRFLSVILMSLVVVPVLEGGIGAPSVAESAVYRESVAEAKVLVVHEGLPHRMWGRELLASELKREDVEEIWRYPFYVPGVEAKDSQDLRALLSSPASIKVHSGMKLCGGFHPDYCISWEADGITYYAFVCFGCHEIIFYDGQTSRIYDLPDDAYKRFKELLSVYELKRPKREK